MAAAYGLKMSSGHDPSLNMQILTSIAQKGFRQGYTFTHVHRFKGEEQDVSFELPFATFAMCEKVLTHADPNVYARGTIVGPCQHLVTCLAEDAGTKYPRMSLTSAGAALSRKAFQLFATLFKRIICDMTKKPLAQRFVESPKNVKALITFCNLLNAVPKSRAAATGWRVALARCNPADAETPLESDCQMMKSWFSTAVLSNPAYGPVGWTREKTIAWNFCVHMRDRSTKKALVSLTKLWLLNSRTGKDSQRATFDSPYDTISLMWTCMSYFISPSDLEPYRFFFQWMLVADGKPLVLIPISAMYRACRFQDEQVEATCEDIMELYDAAKKQAEQQYRLLFKSGDWTIKLPWDDVTTADGAEFKDAVLDLHTAEGARLHRGYEHFYRHAAFVYNRAFEDPYQAEAAAICISTKQRSAAAIAAMRRKHTMTEEDDEDTESMVSFLFDQENGVVGLRPPSDRDMQYLLSDDEEEDELSDDVRELLEIIEEPESKVPSKIPPAARKTKSKVTMKNAKRKRDKPSEDGSKKKKTIKKRKLSADADGSERTKSQQARLSNILPHYKLQYSDLGEESTVFPDFLRVQLVTSSMRPRTYWGLTSDNVQFCNLPLVFVKGPFSSEDSLAAHLIANIIKKILQSEYLTINTMAIFRMIPDRGGESAEPKPFLVCRDLLGITPEMIRKQEPSKTCSSKLEIGVTILDRDAANLSTFQMNSEMLRLLDDRGKMFQRAQINLLCTLIFRYACRIRDTCLRNLLLDAETGKIHSVDESTLFGNPASTLFSKPLSIKDAQMMKGWLNKHWSAISRELDRWSLVIQENDKLANLLDIVGHSKEKLINCVNSLNNLELVKSLL